MQTESCFRRRAGRIEFSFVLEQTKTHKIILVSTVLNELNKDLK